MDDSFSPVWFESAHGLFEWFEGNHARCSEIWIGFKKKAAGIPSIEYAEAQDLALCFGWVETRTRRFDELSYVIRYTPRKKNGIWSQKNIEKMELLIAEGAAMPAGLEAFRSRKMENTQRYSYENRPMEFEEHRQAQLQSNPKAIQFWEAVTPSYRRTVIYWVESAKQETTRERRFSQALEACECGVKLKQFQSS